MIEACAGNVSGTDVRASAKRRPDEARRSSAGVNPRPSRSARIVSIVMSRIFGRAAGTGAGVEPVQAVRAQQDGN